VGCEINIYVVWMRKPYNLSHCNNVRGTNIDYIEALYNFYDISHKVYFEEVQRYDNDLIACWKKHIIDSTRGTTTFRPPPARPILKSIADLLDEYQMPVGYISHDKSKTLHAIAADASKGLQLLERSGWYGFRGNTLGRLNIVREGSQGLTVRRVWGGWSTDVGHEPNAEKAVHDGPLSSNSCRALATEGISFGSCDCSLVGSSLDSMVEGSAVSSPSSPAYQQWGP
jgi:hypothetical protein